MATKRKLPESFTITFRRRSVTISSPTALPAGVVEMMHNYVPVLHALTGWQGLVVIVDRRKRLPAPAKAQT